jgi:hypothetical protein
MQMRPSQAKQKGLDWLGFIRSNPDFPKRYGDSKQHFPILPFFTPICADVLAPSADPHALRGLNIRNQFTRDSAFQEGIVEKSERIICPRAPLMAHGLGVKQSGLGPPRASVLGENLGAGTAKAKGSRAGRRRAGPSRAARTRHGRRSAGFPEESRRPRGDQAGGRGRGVGRGRVVALLSVRAVLSRHRRRRGDPRPISSSKIRSSCRSSMSSCRCLPSFSWPRSFSCSCTHIRSCISSSSPTRRSASIRR